ncbi:UNVERIFIED_CONTAM: hypothetical protein RMT77_009097 [Armadillidium vulgare]
MSKKLVNSVEDCVDEYIAGLLATHRNLVKLPGHKIVLRKDLQNLRGIVAILSGGGSGHEPFQTGYVGRGYLAGAICGPIFTSPTPTSILAAIKAVSFYGAKGVLLLVANYTGDRVNFGLAREWALNEGIKVENVVIGEDCAITSPDRSAGKRGLSGLILASKIAGALAESGESIEKIAEVLRETNNNMGTIGICLTPCTLPGAKVSNFTLDKNEMALGLGVHGEAGVKNVEIRSSKDTVDLMLNHMMDKNSSSHLDLNDKDEVVLLINNLGGTTHLEIGIITDDVVKALNKRGVKVLKVFTGFYFTSLEMAGFNITVLRLSEKLKKENLVSLLEMETDTPVVLASTKNTSSEPDLGQFEKMEKLPILKRRPEIDLNEASLFKECIIESCMSLIAVRDKLNEYDKCAGDGDCGTTLARGSEAILQDLDKLGDFKYPADIFQNISFSCSETMGGTSGGMYSVLMSGIARKLSTNDKFGLKLFSQAFEEGINSLMQYGGAKPGDRTMLDVLKPISEKLNSLAVKGGELPYDEIKSIALNSAERTLNLEAKSGRASYVSKDKLINPDPGAVAVAEIVKACVDVLKIKR